LTADFIIQFDAIKYGKSFPSPHCLSTESVFVSTRNPKPSTKYDYVCLFFFVDREPPSVDRAFFGFVLMNTVAEQTAKNYCYETSSIPYFFDRTFTGDHTSECAAN
jgi:hypothetical protein